MFSSLFQLKGEPEEAKVRRTSEGSFGFSLAGVVGGGHCFGSRWACLLDLAIAVGLVSVQALAEGARRATGAKA
jgi:hypothetical protein